MGWFVLLAVGLFSILGWVIVQTRMGDGSDLINVKAANQSLRGDLDRPKGARVEENERRAAEAHFNKMEKVVIDFLSADSLEEMVKWVRHPERVAPLMESYYTRNRIEPLTFKTTKKYHSISLEKKTFHRPGSESRGTRKRYSHSYRRPAGWNARRLGVVCVLSPNGPRTISRIAANGFDGLEGLCSER